MQGTSKESVVLVYDEPEVTEFYQQVAPNVAMRPIPSLAALNAMRQDESDPIHHSNGAIIDVSRRGGVQIAHQLFNEPPANPFQLVLVVEENAMRIREIPSPLDTLPVFPKPFEDILEFSKTIENMTKEPDDHAA